MIVKARHLKQLALVCAIALAMVEAAAAQAEQKDEFVALPGCNNTCGNVAIQYPFGTGKSSTTGRTCFFDESFKLTCNDSTLLLGDLDISNIFLEGQLEMNFFVARDCYNQSGYLDDGYYAYIWLRDFTISSEKNKFFSVGCDTSGYLTDYKNDHNYSTGCSSICYSANETEIEEGCSGIGCCQVEIPRGMKNITIQAGSFDNYKYTEESFNRCSYSFVYKLDNQGIGFKLSSDHVKHGIPFTKTPMVVDWAVGNESVTCEVAQKGGKYACESKNSKCNETGHGYRCICEQGYHGNPYFPEGCQDINECTNRSAHHCISNGNCKNTNGSYECFCKKWYHGNGTMEDGCQLRNLNTIIVTTAGGFIALVVGMSMIYLVYQKRKLIKLKERFFRQNGGFILQQQLSTREDSSRSSTQIFTAEELKKATKNYDESLIVGKGGYGTVFKGFLTGNKIVAIKKSKLVDQSQIEQFINEVVVLSQINHKNVVKLLGCCLETEVPLLVYEFVNNGTLFDCIHNENKVSWETRLRIATEAAGALSYLHSAASIPIIHRDVKTANILLDENYTAKVSDFGASRLVPMDHAEIATIVQGTVGYLDPEYMLTSQLTEKSDVYSFGVVLVELLTGEKVVSFARPEEKRSLAFHFLCCFRENRLFEVIERGILNEENKGEVMEVAVLASKCLRLIGEERPCMKEVAIELEGIRMMKHPWGCSNVELNLEETEHLLQETYRVHEHGDSSNHQNIGYDSSKDHVLHAFDVHGR